jgi:antitoxin StbD
MTRLLTNEIASITELREPQKVLARANGKPVAILKNSKPVAYLVPAEAVQDPGDHRVAKMEEVLAALEATRQDAQPVLDYLKDK